MKSGKRIISKNINESVNVGLNQATQDNVTDKADSEALVVNKKMFYTMLKWKFGSLVNYGVISIGGNQKFDGEQIESKIGWFEIQKNPKFEKTWTSTLHMIKLNDKGELDFLFQPKEYSPTCIHKTWDELPFEYLERICKVMYPIYTYLQNKYTSKVNTAKTFIKDKNWLNGIKEKYGEYGVDIAKAVLRKYDKNNLGSFFSFNLNRENSETDKELLSIIYDDGFYDKSQIRNSKIKKIVLYDTGEIKVEIQKGESNWSNAESLDKFGDDSKAQILMYITGKYPLDLKVGSPEYNKILEFVKNEGKWDYQGETPATRVVYFIKKREKIEDCYTYVRIKPEDSFFGSVFAIAYENTHHQPSLAVWYDKKNRKDSIYGDRGRHMKELWQHCSWFTRKQISDALAMVINQ